MRTPMHTRIHHCIHTLNLELGYVLLQSPQAFVNALTFYMPGCARHPFLISVARHLQYASASVFGGKRMYVCA